MKINRKSLMARLKKKKTDRGAVTIYISKSVFNEFKKACGEHSASEVIQEMLQDFISQAKR